METGLATQEKIADPRVAELEAEVARLKRALAGAEAATAEHVRAAEQLRLIADALPVLISYIDCDLRYQFSNCAYEEWFGHGRDELTGRHLRDVLGEEAAAGLEDSLHKVLGGDRAHLETRVIHRDGGTREVAVDLVPHRRGDAVAGFFALVRDISDEKTAEAALRESEERFRAMADSAPAPTWVTNEQGIEFVNRAFLDMAGVPAAELMGEGWVRLVHPDDLAAAARRRADAWAKREAYGFEARFRRADGSWRWLHVSSTPRFDGSGALLGFVGMAVDLTEMRQAETRLRQTTIEQAAILSQLAEGVIVADEAGRITFVNQAAARIHGVNRLAVAPDEYSESYHLFTEDGAPYPPDQLPLTRAVRTGAAISDEAWRIHTPDGRDVLARGSARPVFDDEGKRIATVLTLRDETARSEAEKRLQESESRLKALTDNLPNVMIYQVVTSRDMSERRYVYVSASAKRLLGVDAADAMADPSVLMGRIREDQLGMVLQAERAAAAAMTTLDVEISGETPDGMIRSRIISRPRELPDGRLLWDGILIDVTERRLAVEQAQRSAALISAIGDATEDLIFAKDADLRMLYANGATCRTIGIPADRIVGMSNTQIAADPAEAAAFDANDRAVMAGTGTQVVEESFTSPDGKRRVFRSAKTPMRDAAGRIIGLAGVSTDITDRVEAEERLRLSEERLRVTLAAGSLGGWMWDAATGLVDLSEQAAGLFGLDRAQKIPWSAMQPYFHADDATGVADAVERSVAERRDYSVEFRARRLDGAAIWIHSVGRPSFDDAGRPTGMIGAVQDVTARRQAEESLREQSRVLATLNSTGTALAAELDLQKLVQMVTDAGVSLTGASMGAFFYNVLTDDGGSYMLYTLSGADPDQFGFGMPRATAVFHPTFVGEGVIRSDDIKQDPRYGLSAPHFGLPQGHLPVTSFLAVPVISRSGEVIGGLFFGHAEAGRFTEEHEQLMVGLAAQAAIGIDNARLFQAAQRELSQRERAEQELRQLNETLEQRVAEEVAQRAHAEEALRQAQKMETLGQLTGGVAHDFNNLLQIVTGNLDLLQRALPDDAEKLRRAAGNAMRGAERAAVLTQRLLAFSRRQPLAPRPIEPNRLVGGMTDLLHRTLGETLQVETQLAGDVWQTEADPHQLENAILNLAINARDAMGEGGRLTITTANVALTRPPQGSDDDFVAGDFVTISVTDTGCGMDAATVERACEPFFTTKEVGKGTGLGLSMVYGFARQSGGHLGIDSTPGEGTSVHIYLPRLHRPGVAAEIVAETAAPRSRGDETILVCEDDEDVRAFTVEVLRELGYRVVEAGDGAQALQLLAGDGGRHIDLLFTDVVLPGGLTGAAVAEQARKQWPALKLLFTTGYARDAIVHEGRIDPGIELILKPFAYAQLASRVREVLDAEPLSDAALAEHARGAALRAYAPYSGFSVGCAVESIDGEIAVGANMENACYRLGVCAEVSALAAAQQAFGLERVARIAVVGGRVIDGVLTGTLTVTSCGGCRQSILEAAQLSGRDLTILSASGDGHRIEGHAISTLIPFGFGPDNLKS